MEFALLFHQERALVLLGVGGETLPKIADDLILQMLATVAPAPGTGELFHAGAQAAKTHDARRLAKLNAQFIAQTWKEGEFPSVASFADTSTMLAEPALSRWVRRACRRAGA